MKRIVDRLRKLREEGQVIMTPNFCITYNPFRDVFILDVPDDKKVLKLAIPQTENVYYWDAMGIYPVEVAAANYEMAWDDMKPYIRGATIDMIPSFMDGGEEYIWFIDEDESYPVKVSEIIEL